MSLKEIVIGYTMIPPVLFQTSIHKPKQYVIDKIMKHCSGYTYLHFDDNEIIEFFNNNYLEEFANIVEKFKSIKNGAHKSDLFRYYYLYVNGGVYMDSDAMIEMNIENIVRDNHFFTILSHHHQGDLIFQGFIGSTPKNEIIYKALKDAYTIDIDFLNSHYHMLCRNLYGIIKNNKYDFKFTLYEEEIWNFNNNGCSKSFNENNELILSHYCVYKIIPE